MLSASIVLCACYDITSFDVEGGGGGGGVRGWRSVRLLQISYYPTLRSKPLHFHEQIFLKEKVIITLF